MKIPSEATKVFDGVIFDVYQWQQKMFDGSIETFEMLKRVSTVGIIAIKDDKLALLSVHTREWIEYCETKHNYHQYFHTIMYSYEVGVSKPDPMAFELILESLQVKPNETLFIDDSRRNIQAANKLGMHTIHFHNAAQLKKELELHDIKI